MLGLELVRTDDEDIAREVESVAAEVLERLELGLELELCTEEALVDFTAAELELELDAVEDFVDESIDELFEEDDWDLVEVIFEEDD